MINYAIMFEIRTGISLIPELLILFITRAKSLEDAVGSYQDLFSKEEPEISQKLAYREVKSIVDFANLAHYKYKGRYESKPNKNESVLWFDGDNKVFGSLLIKEESFKFF